MGTPSAQCRQTLLPAPLLHLRFPSTPARMFPSMLTGSWTAVVPGDAWSRKAARRTERSWRHAAQPSASTAQHQQLERVCGCDEGNASRCKSEELFKEVFLGLLIASSPYLGFASNVFGLRLVSVCLPHGVGDLLLPGLGIIDRLVLAKGMVKAVSCMTQLDLVYCDLKPGNFMPSHNRTVFVIDFGSVSRPGQWAVNITALHSLVSLAFDVFSLGKVFCEVFLAKNPDVPDQVALLIDQWLRTRGLPWEACDDWGSGSKISAWFSLDSTLGSCKKLGQQTFGRLCKNIVESCMDIHG